MYERVTPMPEMMARVDSITSVMIDIKLISNFGLRISENSKFAILYYLTPLSISRSQPVDNHRARQADQNQQDYDCHDDPGPTLAPGFRYGGHGLLDLRELIRRRIPGRLASEPAVNLRRRHFGCACQSAPVVRAND